MNSDWNQSLLAQDLSQALSMLTKGSGTIVLWLAAGLVIAALLVLAFRGLMMLKDRAKAIPFGNLIKGAAGRSPAGVADPAKVARLDDLRKKFEEGVEKFKSAGKDLYSLPWYLLVGPAGSGKTEALRHCKVGFPPGLQDCFQGAGGTLNMHWWFMNQAVVLDTAGRMFMEEAALQGGSEWREFLKLLKQSRPNAPMNGMLLVIGVDSLIKDTAEQIEAKAGHIAKQLDTIQRTLDVRFPVYVVITKCDLITGFREFFDKIDDPQLQHQMLGWSNPASLDEAFKADGVENHIKTVRSRLLKYRAGLMIDPVHTEDPQARRTDQIDELFSLPDNLAKIAPRLRKYLEIIFQAGEWSPKPLFLRGIYFSSSMRQGQALDEEVAAAMGVPVDAIPGGKVWDEERSFFLRDIFVSKIFKERGLVTRATNVHKEQTGRRRKLIGAGIGVVAVLIALTVYTGWRLKNEVQDPLDFWTTIATVAESPSTEGSQLALVKHPNAAQYFDMSSTKDYMETLKSKNIDAKDRTLIELISDVQKQGTTPIATGVRSRISGLNDRQFEAYVAVMRISILDPVVRQARAELAKVDNNAAWGDEFKAQLAVAVLAELTRAETIARELTPASAKGDWKTAPVNVHAMISFLAQLYETSPQGDKKALEEKLATMLKSDPIADEIVSTATPEYLRKSGAFGSETSLKELEAAVANAGPSWTTIGKSENYELGRLVKLRGAMDAFAEEENALRDPFVNDKKFVRTMPATLELYNKLAKEYTEGFKALTEGKNNRYETLAQLYARNSASLDKIGSTPRLAADVMDGLKGRFDEVLGTLPADVEKKENASLANLSAAIKKSKDATKKGLEDAAESLASSTVGMNSDKYKALYEKSGTEPGFESVVKAHRLLVGVLTQVEPAPAWLEIADGAGKAKAAATSADAELAKLGAASKKPLVDSQVFSAVGRGVAIARGGHLSASIEGLLKELDAQVDRKEDLAAAIKKESKDEGFLPVIPLTRLATENTPADYAPKGTRKLLSSWKVVKDETAGDKAGSLVGGSTLKDRSIRHETKVRAYADGYQKYWYGDVYLKQSRVRDDFRDWAEASGAYSANRSGMNPASKINEPLRSLCEQIGRDLALIDDILGTKSYEDIVKQLEKQALAYAAGNDSTGEKNIGSVKNELLSLIDAKSSAGQSPAFAARIYLRTICESDEAAIGRLNATSGKDSPLNFYWRDLPLRLLGALERSVQAEAEGHAAELIKLTKFPLIRDQTSGVIMPQELGAVEAALGGLPKAAGTEVSKPRYLDDLDNDLKSVVRRILSPDRLGLDKVLELGNVEKMGGFLKVSKAFAGKSMIESIEFVRGEPSGTQPARDIAEFVRVDLAGVKKDLLLSDEVFNADAVKFDLTQEQSLEFTLIKNGVPIAPAAQFPAPWSAHRLLALSNAPKDDKGYTIPIVFTGTDGKRYGFNLRLKLRQGVQMPDLADWPMSITPKP